MLWQYVGSVTFHVMQTFAGSKRWMGTRARFRRLFSLRYGLEPQFGRMANAVHRMLCRVCNSVPLQVQAPELLLNFVQRRGLLFRDSDGL